jgi:hypothetical protein
MAPHLAQINAATLRFPLDDPRLSGFAAAVDRINRLAEAAPGFLWHHPDAHHGLHRPDGDEGAGVTIVNLSTWESYETLHVFVYRSAHGRLVRRRAQWFMSSSGPTTALWWARNGERPSPSAALARLTYLRRHGPSPQAFTVRYRFDPDGRPDRRSGWPGAAARSARSGSDRCGVTTNQEYGKLRW